MRFIIYGAGAIGGLIGARLFEAENDVVLIARGLHGRAIEANGLRVISPESDHVLKIPVVTHPSDIRFDEDDTVIMSMKTQDTLSAILDLKATTSSDTPIICAQNGVENERTALRFFKNVYGLLVICPVTHLSPGEIVAHSLSPWGIFDIGCYPSGSNEAAEQMAASFEGAGFSSRIRSDIMRWKFGKLLDNVGNAVEVVLEPSAARREVSAAARKEATDCFAHSGLDFIPAEEIDQHRRGVLQSGEIDGYVHRGSSTWQSVMRGSTVESDYLNGEITLAGRLNGFPTPVNSLLQDLAASVSSGKREQGAITEREFFSMLEE